MKISRQKCKFHWNGTTVGCAPCQDGACFKLAYQSRSASINYSLPGKERTPPEEMPSLSLQINKNKFKNNSLQNRMSWMHFEVINYFWTVEKLFVHSLSFFHSYFLLCLDAIDIQQSPHNGHMAVTYTKLTCMNKTICKLKPKLEHNLCTLSSV